MFDRTLKVISFNDFKKIQDLNILIIGLGGVGGSALETLVRMGVLNITIVDNDIVDISNLNRQIISLQSNIGLKKVDVAKNRVLDINPNVNISTIDEFILKDNIDILNIKEFDYVIDACDTVSTKVLLINECQRNNIKIISCMGTGNRFNPNKLEITDIFNTKNDPLAKVLRKLLKDSGIEHQKVVYSSELPVKTKDRTPGSTAIVPNCAGIYCAYYIINDTIK